MELIHLVRHTGLQYFAVVFLREKLERSDAARVHQKFTTGVLKKRAHSRKLATTSAILDAGATGIAAMSEVVAPLKRGATSVCSKFSQPCRAHEMLFAVQVYEQPLPFRPLRAKK